MTQNYSRYKVDIPAYIVVMLDDNLSVVSHYIDIATIIAHPHEVQPSVVDYDSTVSMYDIEHPEAQDQWRNALAYARGLHLLNYSQVKTLAGTEVCEVPGSEDIF